jgi:hypothetical protein
MIRLAFFCTQVVQSKAVTRLLVPADDAIAQKILEMIASVRVGEKAV